MANKTFEVTVDGRMNLIEAAKHETQAPQDGSGPWIVFLTEGGDEVARFKAGKVDGIVDRASIRRPKSSTIFKPKKS